MKILKKPNKMLPHRDMAVNEWMYVCPGVL